MDENCGAPTKRRWWQFSLRTLFSLFLLGAGFGVGWTARIAYEGWGMQMWIDAVSSSAESGPYEAGEQHSTRFEYIEGLDVYLGDPPPSDPEERRENAERAFDSIRRREKAQRTD